MLYYYITKSSNNKYGFEIRKRERPDDQGELISKNLKQYNSKEAVISDLSGLHSIDIIDSNLDLIKTVDACKIYKAENDAVAVSNYNLTREKINEYGISYIELHIETFHSLGPTKIEHDMDEPVDTRETSGTRYYSKFSNYQINKIVAIRARFSENGIIFDVVNVSNDGSVNVDNSFKINYIYFKKLNFIEKT